jgi:CheY-like chemotaxis protein
MDTQDHADDSPSAPDPGAVWASACLTALMERHGVASRNQATLIAQICSISISQARRKLRGAVWLFGEVLALCRHFGESLDAVFAPAVMQSGSSAAACGHPAAAASYPATLLIDGQRQPCDIQLGEQCTQLDATAAHPGLVAMHHPVDGWVVGSLARLAQDQIPAPRYVVDSVQLRQATEQARARIAVLDDDLGSASALTDWFNELGYQAHAYTSSDQLLATPLQDHDAFVVDLILAGGQTSQALVERIRQAQPQAPIVLLTGQLRDGTATEATLATILRTQGVTFFEKPVRPAVLTAAIQSGLDRLQPDHA